MVNKRNAKRYCCEDISKIENYDKAIADKTQTWVCHHRTEIWWNCSKKELIENECYYGRKALELIFLTKSEHDRLHNSGENNPMYGKPSYMYGKHHSEETRQKIGVANKGHAGYWSGKTFSEETRRKLSDSHKGKTSPTKGKSWKLIDGKRVWIDKD